MLHNGIECEEFRDIYVDEPTAIINAKEYLVGGEIIRRDVEVQVKEGFTFLGETGNG